MSCNCKNGQSVNQILENGSVKEKKIGKIIGKYTLKVVAFLFFIVLLPIINIYLIWLGFKMLVLNESIDIRPLLVAIGKKFNEKEIEENLDISDFNEEELILTNVEILPSK